MFDTDTFSNILQKIVNQYESISEFAEKSKVNRTYLSKYINKKLDTPPSPKVLMKIANNSHKITDYSELMFICGYLSQNMKVEEICKNIFNKYLPELNKLDLNKELINTIQLTAIKPTTENNEKFNKLISTFSEEKQNQILEIATKIMNETNEVFESSIQKIKLDIGYILEDVDTNAFSIPVVGKIAAGQPILAEEYQQGTLPVDPNIYGLTSPEDLFYLLVSGDSMDRKVQNGDYVLIHKQDYAEDGDIIVAIVNDDDEATLKKYKVINEQFVQLEPMSNNPAYETRTIDLKNTKFLIIGKAIGKFGKF